ncbi:MAG: SH3 domain-containing protein [Steroidobacteraceae bacterium]
MGRIRFAVVAGAALLAVSMGVQAQNAYTSRSANLRAGPDRSYPLVVQINAGTPVDVMGCLDDWSWCDVAFDDTHGWVYAPSLAYVYQGEQVPLYTYAPSLGLPIITFSLGTYWDRYYRGRPWYAQRGQWEHRNIPHRRPRGPAPRTGLPPPHAAAGRGFARPGGPRPGGVRQRGGSAAPQRGPRGHEARPPAHEAHPPAHAPGSRTAIPQRRGAPPERGAPQAGGQHGAEQGRGGAHGTGGEHPQSGHGDNHRDEGQGGPPH